MRDDIWTVKRISIPAAVHNIIFLIIIYLCPEYDKEAFDSFRITGISDNDVDKTVRELKKTLDPDTAEALDYGVWLGYL